MMRHTGGFAVGEISTRSRFFARAIFSASNGGRIPICWPSSSITRISRARIRSLVRIKRLSINPPLNSTACMGWKIIANGRGRRHWADLRTQKYGGGPSQNPGGGGFGGENEKKGRGAG